MLTGSLLLAKSIPQHNHSGNEATLVMIGNWRMMLGSA